MNLGVAIVIYHDVSNTEIMLVSVKRLQKLVSRAILKLDVALYGGSPDIFNKIYQHNSWGDKESVSGTGSNLEQTAVIREEIPVLLGRLGAASLLDIPCGDFYWMKEVDIRVQYTGGDIVPALISANQRKYSSETRTFALLDLLKDRLPRADVVLCRDCLIHFSFKDAAAAIRNLKTSGSTYLLTTTFTNCTKNRDIKTGDGRHINLQLPPFNFPEPIIVLNEGCTECGSKDSDKSLALWKLTDIP